MKNALQKTMIAIFLMVLLLPLIQQTTGIVPEPRLTEKRRLISVPNITVNAYLSWVFQKQFDRYMNDNYGFRAWIVMINNQINISIFHVTQ